MPQRKTKPLVNDPRPAKSKRQESRAAAAGQSREKRAVTDEYTAWLLSKRGSIPKNIDLEF